ncbi:MAG TPA: TRAP transporter small permease [Sphaerochaeta sp.]|jgi:TRAP-type C4-dicarboxylate transport system permease small subunit|nr:TRAP transporter small permease [Spirochaetales bacterium]HKM05542.1 TRAP transporter small permease [Sphaerochaeta sp.]
MEQLKKILDSVFVWVLKLAMVLLVAMVVLVFLNVVLRYGFSSGVYWSEEISLVIVIWFTFIAMALGVKESLHINVDILPKKLPKGFFITLDCIRDLLVILIGGIMIYYGWKLTLNGAKSFLPATQIPNSINYVVLPIAGIFIVLYAVVHLYDDILKFKGGDSK